MDGSTAQSIYREEKARAQQQRRMSHAQLMNEAKEAFAKMLADAQLARKGGRPKGSTNAAPAAAAQAKGKPVVTPVKKAPEASAVQAKAPAKSVTKAAAPAKKAPAKVARPAAKRAHPVSAKRPAKKAAAAKKPAHARASRPPARKKTAKKH